jgi:hypothetical protein
VNHSDRQNTTGRMTLMIRTSVLLKCLKKAGYFDNKKYSDQIFTKDELYIATLLYHFQAGIQYNLHSVYQVKECVCLTTPVKDTLCIIV